MSTQPAAPKTLQEVIAQILALISAEALRAKGHTDVGDPQGAVHHKSKGQVLQELVNWIKGIA